MTAQASGAAYLRARQTAVYSVDDGPIFLALLPDGPILVLEGVAALIYEEATAAPADEWMRRIVLATGHGWSAIKGDVLHFVDDLVERGFLVPAE